MNFVSFDLAKKLKEKGFDKECLAYYTSEYTLYTNKVVLCDDKYFEVAEIDYEECLRSYNTQRLLRTIVDAPTISQVLKWLREEKKIFVDIRFNRYYQLYKYYVFTMSTDSEDMYGEYPFNTYEQAALAGIEYVLENLI